MEDILTQVKTMEKDGVPQEQIQRIVNAYNSKKTPTSRKGTLGGNIINRIIQAPASAAVRTGELLGYAGIKGVAAITGNKELSQKADTAIDTLNTSTQKVPGAFGSDINVKSTTDKTVGGALRQSTAEGLETVSLGIGAVKPFIGAGLAARGANYLAQVGTGYISDVAGNIIDDAESPAKPGLSTALAAVSPAFSPIIKGVISGVKGTPAGLAKIGRIIKASLTDSVEIIQAKKAAKIIEDMPFNVVTGEKAIGESKVGIARAADIISETKSNMGVTGPVTPAKFIDIFKQSTSDVVKAGRQAAINAEEAGLHTQKPGWLKPLTDKLDELKLSDGDKEIQDLFSSVKNDLGKIEITPTRLFDWLQTANENYGSTAQKAKKLREIADAGREAIDNVTDRGSYRDSYRAMMEYKKMLVMAIRKTEKKSDFSDLISDVAVDIAFASQFANPAFLLRGVTQNVLGKAWAKFGKTKQLTGLMDLVDIAGDLRKTSAMPNTVPRYKQPPAVTVPGKTVASNPTIIKPAVDFVTDPFGKTVKAQKGLKVAPNGKIIAPTLAAVGAVGLASQAESIEAAVKDAPNPETKQFADVRKKAVKVIPGTKYADVLPEDTKMIESAISHYKKLFPDDSEKGITITPKEIKALYSKESSAGLNDNDSGDKTRYNGYAWLFGLEKETINDYLKSTKSRDKKIAPFLEDLNTPQKAFNAAVLIWRMKKLDTEPEVDSKGKVTGHLNLKKVLNPKEAYIQYNGKATTEEKTDYQQIYESIK